MKGLRTICCTIDVVLQDFYSWTPILLCYDVLIVAPSRMLQQSAHAKFSSDLNLKQKPDQNMFVSLVI